MNYSTPLKEALQETKRLLAQSEYLREKGISLSNLPKDIDQIFFEDFWSDSHNNSKEFNKTN
jgi:hypothetical protein